jgi:hypothetical protein
LGDETIQFASRFSGAVTQLALLAGDATPGELAKALGPDVVARTRSALDAVEAVYETGTDGVRDWPERRKRVLARLARVREALGRSGIDAELRLRVRALVEAIEERSGAR